MDVNWCFLHGRDYWLSRYSDGHVSFKYFAFTAPSLTVKAYCFSVTSEFYESYIFVAKIVTYLELFGNIFISNRKISLRNK